MRQVLKASLAEATAASSSACVAKGTRASTSCVAGLTMSRHSLVFDSTNLPPIKSLTVATWVFGVVVASMGFVSCEYVACVAGSSRILALQICHDNRQICAIALQKCRAQPEVM